VHGKASFAVRFLLCRAPSFILFVFYFISSNTYIFLLVLLFDDYLLVLLKTMCNTKLVSMLIPHKYQGSGAPAAVPLLPPKTAGRRVYPR
jgi:hypothetical protein